MVKSGCRKGGVEWEMITKDRLETQPDNLEWQMEPYELFLFELEIYLISWIFEGSFSSRTETSVGILTWKKLFKWEQHITVCVWMDERLQSALGTTEVQTSTIWVETISHLKAPCLPLKSLKGCMFEKEEEKKRFYLDADTGEVKNRCVWWRCLTTINHAHTKHAKTRLK